MALLKRAFEKSVLGPLKYRRGSGYDAQRYWKERFDRYGTSLRGAGHEGMTEEENQANYAQAEKDLLALLARNDVALDEARVLEVGVGTGYYTSAMRRSNVAHYTGVDITDSLFPELRSRFPDFEFHQQDITQTPVSETFDLVLLIDVAEHIVEEEAFRAAVANLEAAVTPGGYLLIGPFVEAPKRHLFYVRFWSTSEARSMIRLNEIDETPFRDGRLLLYRRDS